MSFNNLDTLYRQVIMDHYKNPRNKGVIEGDVLTVDMNNPTCGDRIQLQLQVEDGIVQEAKFDGEGCSISMASASMMTQAVKGKKIDDALEMSELFSKMMLGEDVDMDKLSLEDIEALQGVAKFPARIKCATLAWKAMEKGVNEE
ncbi:Fe-S cluster assembly sulfur transfer protein SufU [Virgibacillus halodenitrificans]|jgi:nitrogen fixation protein NifU and related proteins|uniref:SUF system NifU family Fe-S cluster assembly protein n=1 Tax=Virgibacillus halodenitrificans TaxID=1482 RepID=A0AAC9J1K3_VIRHA|nr:SUF system NifU family Fe-S cluster assembly protein [Virgibacillus halodenitrificans]APC48994.1 SUF system NifU family Fe-S cluster assembly protein [Virgibacillus halodenitrificans]MBD1223378.1 SUF system NifU family Fe-S cluster assembly protein [Virgibacillus halodenitrificans]MCG1026956.1 SUF system NifU family Fe-S cluster assembly protein [Virgibacillus halodenitrificans]MCJ0932706.1 SUF system NifU family Fe-S cluster assembly protein [Virgibacillus halodenitrificans]MEC2159004.1 SU